MEVLLNAFSPEAQGSAADAQHFAEGAQDLALGTFILLQVLAQGERRRPRASLGRAPVARLHQQRPMGRESHSAFFNIYKIHNHSG
jgi:hypothetical protein